VSLEPGVPNEYDYIFTGEADEAPGIMAGDLYVRIKIEKHRVFVRKGADIYIPDYKISLIEALTGVFIELQHLDGTKLKIVTAPGDIISHEMKKSVKGLGMPFFKDSFSYGNLNIIFNVEFPKKGSLNEQALESLRALLPAPKKSPLNPKAKFQFLEEFKESEINLNPEGGRSNFPSIFIYKLEKKQLDEDDENQQGG